MTRQTVDGYTYKLGTPHTPCAAMTAERKELGQILLERNLITQEQLKEALAAQLSGKRFLGEILVEKGYVSRQAIFEALTKQRSATFVDISRLKGLRPDVVRTIPEHIARRYVVLAISDSGDTLIVAMKDPVDIVAIDAIRRITGKDIKVMQADEQDILEAIEKYYMESVDLSQTFADLEAVRQPTDEEEVDVGQLRVAAEDAPIIKFVNTLFLQAIDRRATDIHLEPQENSCAVRFRIDGILHEVAPPPRTAFPGIVSRLKIMANLDIGERRLPQDGRFTIRTGPREINIRLSTLPTVHGEKVAMRLLDKNSLLVDMEQLGFSPKDLEVFKGALQMPHGMILVTGPTGSGKTTTLYSGLSFINTPDQNITTVEDPVEYELKGINQVQIRPKIGLTFPVVLRTLLRQDPDVIMIGEIRDLETAQIAIQAALTGHLVISTLHTNDSVSTISRLAYMGVEPYLIAASVNLLMAQRLVRRICMSCRAEDENGYGLLRKVMPAQAEGKKTYRGGGCPDCEYTGYFGRIAVYEVFPVTPQVRQMIVEGKSEDEIRTHARGAGLMTLREAALEKALQGMTTVEEALASTLQ